MENKSSPVLPAVAVLLVPGEEESAPSPSDNTKATLVLGRREIWGCALGGLLKQEKLLSHFQPGKGLSTEICQTSKR